MLIFSIVLFCLGLYIGLFSLNELIQAIRYRHEKPMADTHDAWQTATEIHRRLKRRYYGTIFVHFGDREFKFHSWSRRLLKRKGPDAFVELVRSCHINGCEIIIEDDKESSEKHLTNIEREQSLVFHSEIPAMSDSDFEDCLD